MTDPPAVTAPAAAPPRSRPGGPLRRRLASNTAVYVLVAIALLVVALPLLWMLATAFKTDGQIVDLRSPLWPTSLDLGNLAQAWARAPFPRYFLNSAIFSVAATLGQVGSGLLAGYAFARFDFPGKRVLFYVALSGFMVPFTTVIVPVVEILGDLGWLDTYQGLIVPNIASALGAFLFRQFFAGVPRELGEAASIDGASDFRIFRSVYAPLARPMIAAFAIISFLTNWNNFLFPLIVTNSTDMMVLPLGLSVFETQFSVAYNLIMAASLITIVPILIVAVAAQRQIVEGITLGAIQ
ncbi:MAG: carbohydrate ABC transporter permease [Candidatus Dormibacteraceae bacterium]